VSLSSSSTLTDDGLRDGDVIRSINGTTVNSIESVRKLLLSPAIADTGAFEATVVHEGESATDQVSIDLGTTLNAEAPKGFFGVGQDLVPNKLNVIEAVPESFRWFGDTAKQTVSGMVSFFSLSSLSNFAQRTFSTTPGETRVSDTAQTAQAGAEASQERDGKRIVSIVGVVLLGGDLTASGWGNLLMFLAFLNMALGIFNLAPLPPFDGGHVVIGTYEKIRELLRRDGKRYFADANKLMPVALAVISFTLIIGLMAIYLDLADPIRV